MINLCHVGTECKSITNDPIAIHLACDDSYSSPFAVLNLEELLWIKESGYIDAKK